MKYSPGNETLAVVSTVRTTPATYAIPLSWRRMENLHIVFWLFKDIAWCLVWKPLGIAMIFPTLVIAIVISWRTRNFMSELCHNLAIVFWISANAYWMISEFAGIDETTVYEAVTFKHLALIPFFMGMLTLVYYYLVWKPRNRHIAETM